MSDEIVAANQGSEANPWPHPRPDCMTDTHAILLKAFWDEGLTPTPMIQELYACVPTLSPSQCRDIVMHWMWAENLRMR